MIREILLAYEGEMALKGLNRGSFENKLAKRIRARLADLGPCTLTQAQSTVYIVPGDAAFDMDEAYRRVKCIFGIARLTRAAVCEKDMAAIGDTAQAYLGDALREVSTFKVEAKRSDKNFALTSPELCRELGAHLLRCFPHLRVDVHHPQYEVMVEIRESGAYLHGPKQEGAGGLPVGCSGTALSLLSGGIDSPVAAYCMARRGLKVHHIHFASPPYTSLWARKKAEDLAKLLWEYTGDSTLYVIAFTPVQEYLRDNAPSPIFTVLLRRSMLRIASDIAAGHGQEALITGESLAQVASQTLPALACTDAAQDLPVLRPCIGMDKTQIIDLARKIGTFDTSILPYEDCCTLFAPAHPKIRPTRKEIAAAEIAMPDLHALECAAAEKAESVPIC